MKKEFVITGAENRPVTLDINIIEEKEKTPLIIFAHGFKGFKDWGHFNLMSDFFAQQGFCFVKFNFSHNGTTPQSLTDFADLKAFGNNNFTKELFDLQKVTDWCLSSDNPFSGSIDYSRVYLMGHSRGGGIVILHSAKDQRIKKLVTLASVSDFESRLRQYHPEEWKTTGVQYIFNSRTQQQMPLYYQFYEDFMLHKKDYDILKKAATLKIPYLIIHGTNDEAVNISEGDALFEHCPTASYLKIRGANHVFGAKHPYPGKELPSDAKFALESALSFFKN